MAPRPLPVIAGTVRVSVQGTTPGGQQWVNVHHARYATGASNPGPTEITAFDALFVKFYIGPAIGGGVFVLGSCRSACKLVQITYTPLDGVSNSLVIPHAASGASATATNAPNEVAQVLTLRTGTRGRRYRGRIYLPPFSSDNYDGNGQLNSAQAGVIITQYNGMKASLGAAQWEVGVASYGHGTDHGVPTTWSPFFTPITTVTMDLAADVQRRRK